MDQSFLHAFMVMYLNRNTFVSEGYKAAVRTVCWVLVDPSLLGRQGRAGQRAGRAEGRPSSVGGCGQPCPSSGIGAGPAHQRAMWMGL